MSGWEIVCLVAYLFVVFALLLYPLGSEIVRRRKIIKRRKW